MKRKKFVKPEVQFDWHDELVNLICEKLQILDIPLQELKSKFKKTLLRGALIEEFFYIGNKKEINSIIEIWNAGYDVARSRFEQTICFCGENH